MRTRAVACKQMTMVTPIHLLLFGGRKIEYTKGVVQIDNWYAIFTIFKILK